MVELVCFRSELYKALRVVSRVVPGKPPAVIVPFGGILMRATGNNLSLTGCNLDTGITTNIKSKVDIEGEMNLPAKVFTDIVRCLPDEEVSIKSDDHYLTTIKSGSVEYTITGIPTQEYPKIPTISNGKRIMLPANKLKSMIKQTLFAVATNDTRPQHTGVLFNVSPDGLTVVSEDGYRLALRRESATGGLAAHFIMPGKTLTELSKLLRGNGEIQIQFNNRHAIIFIESFQIFTRLLEEEFLDYDSAIPKDSQTTVVVSTKALIDSISRTRLLITNRRKKTLRLKFVGTQVKLSCNTEMGYVCDELPCTIAGPELEVGVNSRYLLDALRAVKEDEVKLEFGSPAQDIIQTMKMVSPENDRFLFMILLDRLQPER